MHPACCLQPAATFPTPPPSQHTTHLGARVLQPPLNEAVRQLGQPGHCGVGAGQRRLLCSAPADAVRLTVCRLCPSNYKHSSHPVMAGPSAPLMPANLVQREASSPGLPFQYSAIASCSSASRGWAAGERARLQGTLRPGCQATVHAVNSLAETWSSEHSSTHLIVHQGQAVSVHSICVKRGIIHATPADVADLLQAQKVGRRAHAGL